MQFFQCTYFPCTYCVIHKINSHSICNSVPKYYHGRFPAWTFSFRYLMSHVFYISCQGHCHPLSRSSRLFVKQIALIRLVSCFKKCSDQIGGLSVYNLDGHLLRNTRVIYILNILFPEVAAEWSFRRSPRSLLLPPQPLPTQNALRWKPAWGHGAIRGGGDDTKCYCNLLWV